MGSRSALFVAVSGFLSAFLWALFSPIRHLRMHPPPSEEEIDTTEESFAAQRNPDWMA
jgi:hypothetical protein